MNTGLKFLLGAAAAGAVFAVARKPAKRRSGMDGPGGIKGPGGGATPQGPSGERIVSGSATVTAPQKVILHPNLVDLADGQSVTITAKLTVRMIPQGQGGPFGALPWSWGPHCDEKNGDDCVAQPPWTNTRHVVAVATRIGDAITIKVTSDVSTTDENPWPYQGRGSSYYWDGGAGYPRLRQEGHGVAVELPAAKPLARRESANSFEDIPTTYAVTAVYTVTA